MPPTSRRPAVPGAASPMVPPPPPLNPQQTPQQTPPPQQQPTSPAANVPAQQPAAQPSSSHANMFANTGAGAGAANGQGAGGVSITLDSVIGGNVDPERDRRPDAYRVRRYVIEALDAAWRLQMFRDANGQPMKKQDIADMAIASVLPPELLDAAYRKLYGRERPTPTD